MVPDSSLFRHRFAVSGRSEQERYNFPCISLSPFVLLLPVSLLLFFPSFVLSLPLCCGLFFFFRYRFIVWCHLCRKCPHSVLGRSAHVAEVVTPDLVFPGMRLRTCLFAKVCPFLPGSGGCGFEVPQNILRSPSTSENKA